MSTTFEIQDRLVSPELSSRIEQYVASGDTTPMHVDLDLTTDCNYRCRHCGDLARGLLNKGGLSREVIDALLDDLRALGVHEVVLIGGGEPTLSPHFAHTVQGLFARGIRCGVVTNGSSVSASALDAMRSGCAWVRVSLDAATASTYGKVHDPDDGTTFEMVVENIERMVAAMGRRVGVSFLITPSNAHEIDAAAGLAKGWGAGYIRIRPMQHPITGTALHLRAWDGILAQVQSASALADAEFEVSIGDALAVVEDAAMQSKEYRRCRAQAFGATISGEGKVYVCSKWRGERWACIGDLRTERFPQIWMGPRRFEVLNTLSPARQCQHVYCHAHPLNVLLAARLADDALRPAIDPPRS